MASTLFKMRNEVWLYPGENASWHFVTLPKKEGESIKKSFGMNSKGWGSLPVRAVIGKTSWKTSIFPDKRSGSYILPLKAEVRRKEEIYEKDIISFSITLDL